MKIRFSKGVIIAISLFILLTSFQPAYAVDKSRVFVWLMFCSGLGSSTAGAILQGQANETYDQYLHTAVQADMNRLIDDHDQKRQQSVIASRAGIGLVVGAILLSLVDAAHIPTPEAQKTPAGFSSEYGTASDQIISAQARNGEIFLSIGDRF